MAEEFDDQRTLPPTPRRLEQARAEGQVARSRELAACATVAAAAIAAWGVGPTAFAACERIVARGLTFGPSATLSNAALTERLGSATLDGLVTLMPLLALIAAAGIGATLAVGGWLFAPQAIAPNFDRLSPMRGLGQIFSIHGLAELGKSLAKALVILVAAGVFLWTQRDSLAANDLRFKVEVIDEGAIMIRWGKSIPGREAASLAVFGSARPKFIQPEYHVPDVTLWSVSSA